MRTLVDSPPRPPEEAPSRKRKLAAILHADVVGFSRLMGEDEAGTHRTLGELRRALDPLIATHQGRIVGTAGDSLLADFSSVVDALSCAVAMQRAARAVNDPLPPERRLEPSHAAPYAELGLSLIEGVSSGWTEFIADDLGRAEALAQKALSLDPSSASAYRLLAEIALMRGHTDLAVDRSERAVEINPNDAEICATRGEMLVLAGRAAEGVPWLKDALRLDPTDARAEFLLGMADYFLDRYDEAVDVMSRGLAERPRADCPIDRRPV